MQKHIFHSGLHSVLHQPSTSLIGTQAQSVTFNQNVMDPVAHASWPENFRSDPLYSDKRLDSQPRQKIPCTIAALQLYYGKIELSMAAYFTQRKLPLAHSLLGSLSSPALNKSTACDRPIKAVFTLHCGTLCKGPMDRCLSLYDFWYRKIFPIILSDNFHPHFHVSNYHKISILHLR